jgi:hypothetical protein
MPDYSDLNVSSSSSSTLRPAVWDRVAKAPDKLYCMPDGPLRPLPKPKGEVGRSGSKGGVNRGYNLEATLQWPGDLFKEVQVAIYHFLIDRRKLPWLIKVSIFQGLYQEFGGGLLRHVPIIQQTIITGKEYGA